MSSERPAERLRDIVENIHAIFRYTAEMNFETFRRDQKTHDAVERCLERVSEAASKLGDLAPILMPEQPWHSIRALGNRLRHDYDAVRSDRLWDIVKADLPALCQACEIALRNLDSRE